jgi:hypothetical protein
MGFKIKRLEENRSEALRASRGRPPVPSPQPPPPRRLLAALAMPATPLNTNWSSDPAYTVGPRGWYRQGCWS